MFFGTVQLLVQAVQLQELLAWRFDGSHAQENLPLSPDSETSPLN